MQNKRTIADLHIHSCASDSTQSPREIIDELVEKNIRIASLSDHNTIDNQKEFITLAGENGIKAISGVEISSKIGDMVYHILAYGFDPNNERIPAYVDPLLAEMRNNGRRLVQKMLVDFPCLSLEEYDNFPRVPSLGGWKNLHYFVYKGIIDNPIDGLKFRKIYDCPFSQCNYPSPAEAIREIHSWGAYAVLAHPRSYFPGNNPDCKSINDLFNEMMKYGIDGIECHYPKNTKLMTDTSIEWCRKNNMLITVGCDSHGDFVPGREIGKIRVPLKTLNIGSLLSI